MIVRQRPGTAKGFVFMDTPGYDPVSMTGIVAGLPNKTIAYDLDISPRTVEVHRANVMAKMQARNLPELVRMVLSAKAS